MSDSWRIKSLRNEYKTIQNKATANVESQANNTYGTSWSFNFVKPTNKELTDTYYLDQIKEDIDYILQIK